MKHLKYIKEYFDTEEIKHRVGDNNIDMKKMVSDDSIIEHSVLDVIVTRIKMDLTYIEDFNAQEFHRGIMFNKGYDHYIGSGESLFGLLKMPIDISMLPEELKSGNRLEDMVYQVSYESDIFWIEDDKKLSTFRNEYISDDGEKFKTCKGVVELISVIKKDIIPLMKKTKRMFEKTTLEKIHDNDRPPTRYN